MAYSYETSSVRTINGEVSGLADVVARQALSAQMSLSAGEGINFVEDAENHRTRIDLGLSAGSNMSLVYDQETNTIRLDAEGGTGGLKWTSGANYSALVQSASVSTPYLVLDDSYDVKLGMYSGNRAGLNVSSTKYYYTPTVSLLTDNDVGTTANTDLVPGGLKVNFETTATSSYTDVNSTHFRVNEYGSAYQVKDIWASLDIAGLHSSGLIKDSQTTATSSVNFTFADMKYLQENSASLGKTYTGVAPIVVNNTSNQISADTWSFSAGNGLVFTDDNANKVTKLEVEGETLSAGPGINIFSSGGYVVISAEGGNAFPITGTNGTTGFTANMDCSSMMLTTGASPAGGYVKQTVRGVQYEAYPSTDVSASWYNIINGANNRSNCYCIKLNSTNTAASLEDYSAYDRVTVIHAQDYGPDYLLHWDGKTKTFPSGLYCELAKVKDDVNEDKWTFLNSGWTFDFWWDYD